MAEVMELPSFEDERGVLTVLERALPFEIKRLYWLTHLNQMPRGRHRHLQAEQALICLQGGCRVYVQSPTDDQIFSLNHPHHCLLLPASDWHQLDSFQPNTVVLVVASTYHDKKDYIEEPYRADSTL